MSLYGCNLSDVIIYSAGTINHVLYMSILRAYLQFWESQGNKNKASISAHFLFPRLELKPLMCWDTAYIFSAD